ncbi:hypothetical protein M378DRAFT_171324 [Amanita muscaria Koide BX008]|uniref:Uncharacterized protein n=1 Tax=Amanita muscaria (strain Koide BX008) TaxID=946122 RepID=A0A0C2S514_AMAMK|nr:hypothetical protein M378DRAFT_171324 [Amanita muscaria Koide BX008]
MFVFSTSQCPLLVTALSPSDYVLQHCEINVCLVLEHPGYPVLQNKYLSPAGKESNALSIVIFRLLTRYATARCRARSVRITLPI